MFASDDEDAEFFSSSTDAGPDTFNNHQRQPPPQRNQPLPRPQPAATRPLEQRAGGRPLNSYDDGFSSDYCQPLPRQQQQRSRRAPSPPEPWIHKGPVVLQDADEDPFARYPNEVILNGFIVTNEIPKHRHRTYNFMVFCQEDQKIYGIPRSISTPPYGIKLNEEQRWRKKRDLEFGRKVDFILDPRRTEVREYAKGPSDSIIAENIDGKNCFLVQCVLDTDLKTFYTVEFGASRMREPITYHIENLAYDCQITFDENYAIERRPYFEIYKVIAASADQSIICSTPWIRSLPTPIMSDNDIEELKNPDNYKANVTGLRYAADRVLHLRAENHVKIIFCTAFDNLPPIGSIFQFDYVFHPVKKLAVVAAVIRVDEQLEKRDFDGQDEESDFMFKMSLNIAESKNGFFHDEILGLITDTKRCLRFSPYCSVQRPSDEIEVWIKACLRQPASFDIVEIDQDSYDYIVACEPPFVHTDAVMINRKSGKVFSSKYPGLDLRINEPDRERFKIGEILTGTFYLADPNNFSDNRYISDDAVKENTEPFKTLAIKDDYALVVMKIKRITYTAPISKKQMKKNPQAEDIHYFREYTFFLQNYFEATHGGLIGGSKGRVAANDDYAYSILETCPDGGQFVFNYVSQYDTARYPLDLNDNFMLRTHVAKVLAAREGRQSSLSSTSLSSHTTTTSSIPSSRSSSSLPPFIEETDDDVDASTRTSTPRADREGYSQMSNRDITPPERSSTRERYSEHRDRESYNSDSRYSQNGYRNEHGYSSASTNEAYDRIDSRTHGAYDRSDPRNSIHDGYYRDDSRATSVSSRLSHLDSRAASTNAEYETANSRMSSHVYDRLDSRASSHVYDHENDIRSGHRTPPASHYRPPSSGSAAGYDRSNLPPRAPEPRHQYDRSITPSTGPSRLPPTSTWGRASAQPTSGNRIESRPDSTNSAPAGRGSTWASRVSSATSEFDERENVRPHPSRPASTTSSQHVPPRSQLPPGATWANRGAAENNHRVETSHGPQHCPPLPPKPPSRPPSVATSIHSQNGIPRSHDREPYSSQNSLSSARRPSGAYENDEITERMNHIGISSPPHRQPQPRQPDQLLRRELFPILDGPRYRNMCLYEISENLSPRIAEVLNQMDSYLTNPPPPTTLSIKKKRNETSIPMPEFEWVVAQFSN